MDLVMTNLGAARAMKMQHPTKPLKDLVEESIQSYNNKNKKQRSYMINTEVKTLILALCRCPTQCIQMLMDHYMKFRHAESGSLDEETLPHPTSHP